MAAFVDTIMRAAERGDPSVVHKGTLDPGTAERWMQNAKQRAIRARDAATRTRS
jgi:hypothetical protein